MDFKRILTGATGLTLLVLVLALPLPSFFSGSRVFSSLENASHGPLFAALICLLLWVFGHLAAWLVSALLAMVSEYAQGFGSRDPSWNDVYTDLLGATAGLALWVLFSSKHKPLSSPVRTGLWMLIAACALSVSLPVLKSVEQWLDRSRQYPVLFTARFSGALSMTESMTEDEDVLISQSPDGLSVQLQSGPIPGVVIRGFVPDWRGYKKLVIDIENPDSQPLELEVHLRDRGSTTDKTDRFNAIHILAPRQRTAMQLDLSSIEAAPKADRSSSTSCPSLRSIASNPEQTVLSCTPFAWNRQEPSFRPHVY
jgi:uncharacterized protein YfiM (DUF2279 family)